MNKLSTIIIIAAILFVLYFFRDKLKKLIAPPVHIVINGSTPPAATNPPCDCEANKENTQAETEAETGEYMPEDLLDILYPSSGDFSSGTSIYPNAYNF